MVFCILWQMLLIKSCILFTRRRVRLCLLSSPISTPFYLSCSHSFFCLLSLSISPTLTFSFSLLFSLALVYSLSLSHSLSHSYFHSLSPSFPLLPPLPLSLFNGMSIYLKFSNITSCICYIFYK